MIDFSNYTVHQQQAMNDLLYDLVGRLEDYGQIWDYLREMRTRSDTQLVISIDAQLEQQARDAAEPAGDPPAPPDMFGWVGDALEDLCAAGEVIGNDR